MKLNMKLKKELNKKLLLHNVAGGIFVGAWGLQVLLGTWAVTQGLEAFDQVEKLESELASKSKQYEQIVQTHEDMKKQQEERIKELTQENSELKEYVKELENSKEVCPLKESGELLGKFRISFYDTSYNSQEGWGYQTASGVSLKGKNLYDRLIAVPPHIPLGTKLYLEFENNPELNGIYTGVDRGGAIKGNKIDVFYEDYNMEGSVWDMGIKYANVYLIGE